MTNRKLHPRYRLAPKSMTLDDLEQPFHILFQNTCVFGANHENFNEDRPILSAAKSSAMTVVSGNIRFKWIFAWVPRRRGVKRQWSKRKRRFSVLSDDTSSGPYEMRPIVYYIVLFSPLAFSLTAKYVALNGHFTLNFDHYEQRFQKLFYIITVELIYRIVLLYYVTSRDVRKQTVIRRIFRIHEKLRVLHHRKFGTVTNKANIIIQYYLFSYRLSLISKHVTLNDLEWPFCVKFEA